MKQSLGLLFLHALPLDGSMWNDQMALLPDSIWAPTLYRLGDSIEDWAAEALRSTTSDRLIVVGCSVGGSCAIEVAAAAPERVAALVLIGTKAAHRPDPALQASAQNLLEHEGIDAAWAAYWSPLFSNSTDPAVVEAARQIARRHPLADIVHGVEVFHSRPSRNSFLANWKRSVIVVSGEDDVAPGPDASLALAAAAPFGRNHVIPSCGHYVPIEQPQAFRAILSTVISAQINLS